MCCFNGTAERLWGLRSYARERNDVWMVKISALRAMEKEEKGMGNQKRD